MRRLLLFSMVALLLVPTAASARAKSSGGVPLPPGAVKSDNLEYLGSFGGKGLVEGKFDRVRGRSVLITTGRFGFRIYDVSDPRAPAAAGRVPARDDPRRVGQPEPEGRATGRTRTWTSTRAASSSSARSTRGTTTTTGGAVHGASARSAPEEPRPRLPQRLLRDLLRQPAQPAPGRRLRRPSRGPHRELHQRLRLRVDRRSGAARATWPTSGRSRQAGAATAGRSGSPTCATRASRRSSATRSTCGATTGRRTTRTTSRSTSAASPG